MSDSNFSFIELADYVTPEVSESTSGDWMKWGDDNAFFNYLIELYNNSPTNNACIKGTSVLMYGGGLEVVRADRKLQGYVTLKKIFRPNDVRNVCADFKLFGMAAFEIIYSKTGGKIVRALHLPMNYLRAGECNDDGEIEKWFYATDWEKSDDPNFKPNPIPAFGFEGKNAERSVLIVCPYSYGTHYYATPDYIGSVNWSDVESEISNYHLSNLQNGMWPGMLINFNNGVPTETEQDNIERSIKKKWGKTSKAGRVIVAFNRNKESATTIEPVQLSDAAEQFQAISSEALEKIMLGHRITSPMLLGIKQQTGLGNNAEELQSAHALFMNTVVEPMQDYILDAVDAVLAVNGHSLDVYFKPLTPLEFKDYSVPLDPNTKEKETGLEMSKEAVDLSEDVAHDWLDYLEDKGEKIDVEEWELAYEEEVDSETEDSKVELFKRFSDPSEKSKSGDTGLYKIRYRYSANLSANSRTFCKGMVANSKAGVVYRREDIDLMTQAKLNIDLSPADCKRCGYDIWLYKGGARCSHRWVRQVYFRKRSGGKFMPASDTDAMENDKRVSVKRAEKAGVPDSKLEPEGWNKAKVAPKNTPSKGFKNQK